MSTLVESLRRLYHSTPPRVTDTKLKEMVKKGTLSDDEYAYIVSE